MYSCYQCRFIMADKESDGLHMSELELPNKRRRTEAMRLSQLQIDNIQPFPDTEYLPTIRKAL